MMRCTPLLLALLLLTCCTSAAPLCPLLKEAVETTPDYNHPQLGVTWFTDRGLKKGSRYGCQQPDTAASHPYTFALGCGCKNWEQCHSSDLSYSVGVSERYDSRLGECKCCAWWVILLMVVGSILVVACATQVPRFRKWVGRRYREWKRKRDGAYDAADMGAIEDGTGGAEMTALGPHAALNNSQNDRYNSKLRARRAPAARRRANNASGTLDGFPSAAAAAAGARTSPGAGSRSAPPGISPGMVSLMAATSSGGDTAATASPNFSGLHVQAPAHSRRAAAAAAGSVDFGSPAGASQRSDNVSPPSMVTPRSRGLTPQAGFGTPALATLPGGGGGGLRDTPREFALSIGSRPGELDDYDGTFDDEDTR